MIDLSQPKIEDRRIVLAELFRPNQPTVFEGKIFQRCSLQGPGNIFLTGVCNLRDVRFNDCDFVCVKIPVQIATAIMFRNVHIQDCEIQRVLIMVNAGVAGSIPKDRFITEVPIVASIPTPTRTQQ